MSEPHPTWQPEGQAHPEAPVSQAPTRPLQTASAASGPISAAGPAAAPPNAAVTSFLLQVTSRAPARSRPPACHRHLASNSSRSHPASPTRRAGGAAERLVSDSRLLTGARAAGRPGAAFQFQEQSHPPQRRGHSLAAPGLGKATAGAVGLTRPLTSIRRPKIRNGEGNPSAGKPCPLESPSRCLPSRDNLELFQTAVRASENRETQRSLVCGTLDVGRGPGARADGIRGRPPPKYEEDGARTADGAAAARGSHPRTFGGAGEASRTESGECPGIPSRARSQGGPVPGGPLGTTAPSRATG